MLAYRRSAALLAAVPDTLVVADACAAKIFALILSAIAGAFLPWRTWHVCGGKPLAARRRMVYVTALALFAVPPQCCREVVCATLRGFR